MVKLRLGIQPLVVELQTACGSGLMIVQLGGIGAIVGPPARRSIGDAAARSGTSIAATVLRYIVERGMLLRNSGLITVKREQQRREAGLKLSTLYYERVILMNRTGRWDVPDRL